MTAAEFSEKLAQLIAADPQNVMLPLLRRGWSASNEILLKMQLKKLPASVMSDTSTPTAGKNEPETDLEDDTPDAPEDENLRRMRANLASSFGERAALSNRIPDTPSRSARAALSDEIQVVQRRIGQQMRDIRHYRLHGTLPEQHEEYPIPRDPFALDALINSLRASISRKKKDIENLRREDLTKPTIARKCETAEKKLRDLKTHLEYATTAKGQQKGVYAN